MKLCIFDIPAMIVLGFVISLIYAKKLRGKNQDWWFFLLLLVTGLFWSNVLLSGLGAIKPWFGLFHFVQVSKWIALPAVLSYPLWYNFSGQIATYLFGHDRTQAGMVWPFSIKDGSEPFKPSWKSSQSINNSEE
jgi:hypothetical protein